MTNSESREQIESIIRVGTVPDTSLDPQAGPIPDTNQVSKSH